MTALNKQTKLEKEENKDMAAGKDKEVIDLSLDEETTNVSAEGIITILCNNMLIGYIRAWPFSNQF